jgi:N-acetyl-gamma-glutamyl-phosphate reductase
MSITVAIVGATGYAGEGAARILSGHPDFEIVHLGSDRLAGTAYGEAVPALRGLVGGVLRRDDPQTILASGAKAIVLAKKSPDVTRIVPELTAAGGRLIDIGAEFRFRSHEDYQTYHGDEHECPEWLPKAVYGLSEWRRDEIAEAQVVGNPGCFATSMLLPLLPLFANDLVDGGAPVAVISYSGLSGAGKRHIASNNNLFYAVNENMHSYKALGHQHRGEVNQELAAAAGSSWPKVSFVPHLAPITRGIHTTVSLQLSSGATVDDVYAAWEQAYAEKPFARIWKKPHEVEVLHSTGTNFCDFAAAAEGRSLIITSALDNLIKGAAGQTVQNLNLMYGLDETAGLLQAPY